MSVGTHIPLPAKGNVTVSVDVIYQFSDIKGVDDIYRRGIAKDILCHLLGYAKAYTDAVRDSKNPLNYMTHSGHLFEVASVKGLMEIVDDISHVDYMDLRELFTLLAEHTDDLMLAAEANALGLFFVEHQTREETINRIIAKVVFRLTKKAKLDPKRIEAICQDSLAKNDPEIRIRKLLKATKKP